MIEDLYDDILSWKEKHGSVFCLKVNEREYIFRTLTRSEYFNVLHTQTSMSMNSEETVLQKCLLCPEYNKEDLDNRLAGEVGELINYIILLSGFSDGEQFLKDMEKEREGIKILDNQITLLICKAFPHLTPEKIDQLNYQQTLRYIALSEEILDVKLNTEKPNNNNNIDFNKENKELMGRNSSPIRPNS